jgi:hypothetical protein
LLTNFDTTLDASPLDVFNEDNIDTENVLAVVDDIKEVIVKEVISVIILLLVLQLYCCQSNECKRQLKLTGPHPQSILSLRALACHPNECSHAA